MQSYPPNPHDQQTAYGQFHWGGPLPYYGQPQPPPYVESRPPQAYPMQPYQPYPPHPPMYQQINVQQPRSKPWLWAIVGIVCFILLIGMLCCAFSLGAIGEKNNQNATPTPTNWSPMHSIVQVQGE